MNTIETVICHHGILGQKWGRRRYQNPDGSLTELGRKRYAKQEIKRERKEQKLEAKKHKIITTGDTERLKKYINKFSDRDIQEFQNRKRLLDQLSRGETDASNKMKPSIVEKTKTTVDKARSLLDSYNRAANIVNNITGEETIPEYSLEARKRRKDAAYNKMIDTITPEDILKNWNKIKPSSASDLDKKVKMFNTVQAHVDAKNKRETEEAERERREAAKKPLGYVLADPGSVSGDSYREGNRTRAVDFVGDFSSREYSVSQNDRKQYDNFVSDYLNKPLPSGWNSSASYTFKHSDLYELAESIVCHRRS